MQKCAVCPKSTDKCCSLCRKVFYCSSEHQQVHWHTTHKFNCDGKNQTFDIQQQDFKIYNQPLAKSLYQTAKNNEEDAKIFIELFEDRLVMRKNVLSKYLSAKQSNISPQLNKELIKQCIQLHQVSKKITQSYKATISDILEDSYGLITNNFIVKMDELLDKVLLGRCYQLCFMAKELKEILMVIGNETDPFPEHVGDQFIETYKKLLISVIDISQQANFDKITEKMYANFIKLIQKIDGIWEQAYAYYNMGLWYAKKTYYQKAVKCFTYSIDLITSHKSSKQALDNSVIFKGDALYNIAICRHSLGEKDKSIQNMQQSYRLRAQGLGKSSLEASNSLYILSQWCMQEKKYQNCLQYVMQCLRIRKTNLSFARQLQDVRLLIIKIYQQIRRQKQQNEQGGNMRNNNYYDKLLLNQEAYIEAQVQKKQQSFTKKLLDIKKDLVPFKLVITPELADTFTSQQWMKVGELIDLVDVQMEKQAARQLILESNFSLSLDEGQKSIFIKLNKIV